MDEILHVLQDAIRLFVTLEFGSAADGIDRAESSNLLNDQPNGLMQRQAFCGQLSESVFLAPDSNFEDYEVVELWRFLKNGCPRIGRTVC